MNFFNDSNRSNHEIDGWTMIDVHGAQDLTTDIQRTILQYFNDKTRGKRLARRSDLNPADLKKYLPGIVIFDVLADENGDVQDLSIRLLGTTAASFFGEYTGKNISEYENNPVAKRILGASRQAKINRLPVCCSGTSIIKEKTHRDVHSLFIPFASNGDEINQMFCLFETKPRTP